jgi:hypothetical protein
VPSLAVPENAIAAVSGRSGGGNPRFAHVVFRLDLDPATRVDAPLDRAQLGSELVVIGIDVDLTPVIVV